jgi:hypothetical protein
MPVCTGHKQVTGQVASLQRWASQLLTNVMASNIRTYYQLPVLYLSSLENRHLLNLVVTL